MKNTITLFGRRINLQQLQQLISDILIPAETVYHDLNKQIQEALQHGVDEKAAYNIPKTLAPIFNRYKRALQLYQEYQQLYGTPRADYICTLAKPSYHQHIAHFICGTTSEKQENAHTKYCVALGKSKKKPTPTEKPQNILHLVCGCPDHTNRGGSIPCKHVLFACMWLRDYMVGMYRD